MAEYLLEVKNLKMHFPISGGVFWRQTGTVRAVDDVSFKVKAGETVGLVGESGCGKTTVGRAILRLYDPTDGVVLFNGNNMARLSRGKLRNLRKEMQMIFQDPFESLNLGKRLVIYWKSLLLFTGQVSRKNERGQ